MTGLIGSAFISATEAAILDSNRYKIENLLEEGDSRAKSVIKILNNYEQFFGTILLLGNMFNVVVASVGTTLAISTIFIIIYFIYPSSLLDVISKINII